MTTLDPVADFYAVQGEAKVDMSPILYDGLGAAIDLTGATVTLTLQDPGATSALVTDGACTPDPDQVANRGKVKYTFQAGDLVSASGYYVGRFKVNYVATGVVRRVPTAGFKVYVYPPVGS